MTYVTPAPLPGPVRWVGGKSRLRTQIIPLIPPHSTYVEPFGGGAWVLFGKARSDREVYNDLDADITTLMQVLRDQPEEFLQAFTWEIVARERFETLRDTDPDTLTPIARAHRTFYLLMAGWGGELGSPRFQTGVNDAGRGNRLIGALRSLEKRVTQAHGRLSGVDIRQGDALDVIAAHDDPDSFLYVDPPYPDNGVNYQVNMRGHAEHAALARTLRASRARWMVSSYDTPDTRTLYGPDCVYIPIQSASGMAGAGGAGRVTNREVLVCNYVPAQPAAPTGLFEEIPCSLPTSKARTSFPSSSRALTPPARLL